MLNRPYRLGYVHQPGTVVFNDDPGTDGNTDFTAYCIDAGNTSFEGDGHASQIIVWSDQALAERIVTLLNHGDALIDTLQNVTASLSNVLAHCGAAMTQNDLAARRQLVREAQALLGPLLPRTDDTEE